MVLEKILSIFFIQTYNLSHFSSQSMMKNETEGNEETKGIRICYLLDFSYYFSFLLSSN